MSATFVDQTQSESPTGRGSNRIQDAVFQRGILMSLDFRMMTWSIVLKPQDIGLEKIPDGMRLGRLDLFPKDLVGKPASVQAVTRRSLDQITYPWPHSQAMYLPMDRVEAASRILDRQKIKFLEKIEEILEGYEEKREEAIASWLVRMRRFNDENGLSIDFARFEERLRNAYPTPSQIRKRHVFEWTYYVIDAPKSVRIAAFNEEARERLESSMRTWVEDTVLVLRGRINEIAGRLREVLASQDEGMVGIPKKSKDAILKQIEIVRTLNCFNDSESDMMLNRLQNDISNEFANVGTFERLITETADFAQRDIESSLDEIMLGLVGVNERVVEV